MIRGIVSQLSRTVTYGFKKGSTVIRVRPTTPLEHRFGTLTPTMTQINFRFATENQQSAQDRPKFENFVTNPSILDNLGKHGLIHMFPIQVESFPIIMKNGDLLASDRTGSGKTLAYTLPILQKFHISGENPAKIKKPKFLIMSPTRQLALQVTNQIKKFASDYKIVTVYGGASISEQIRAIERGVAIIVATPGRLIDLIEKGAVDLSELKAVCLDEADTMLQKGFKDDVEMIMGEVQDAVGKTQNLMFSATIPPWVAKIASRYLTNMNKINLIKGEQQRTSQTVQHYALMINKAERHESVLQLIQRFNPDNRTIIFTQTKAQANDFIKYFDQDEIVILHGDIPQNVREINLAKFRRGQQKILIATDVAARGLDIPEVQLVIQLSPPQNPEPYIHRSGRTGRAGKEGVNITFFDKTNIDDLMNIERQAKIKIKIINNNFNIQVWKKEAEHLIQEIANREEDQSDPFYQLFVDELLKKTSPKNALLYFLKHKLGKVPQMTSAITNHKGYITYVAEKTDQNSTAKIQDTFKDFKIFNLTENDTQSKFDILWNDYYHFEQLVEKQTDFQLEILDENNESTLKQIRKNMISTSRFGSNKYSPREERQDRNDRFDRGNRLSRGRDFEEKPLFGDFRSSRYEQRETRSIRNYDLTTNIFLPRLPVEVPQEEIEEEIKNQSGIDSFDLKIINKRSDDGGDYRFGFIRLENPEDSRALLYKSFVINGFKVTPKPSK